MVVAARLEEEVAGLPRRHRDAPGQDRGVSRIDEQQAVSDDEADRADQVQALIDAAVVVIAVVVPALRAQFLQEWLFHDAPVKQRAGGAA